MRHRFLEWVLDLGTVEKKICAFDTKEQGLEYIKVILTAGEKKWRRGGKRNAKQVEEIAVAEHLGLGFRISKQGACLVIKGRSKKT